MKTLNSKLGTWLKDKIDREGQSMRMASVDIGVSHGTIARTVMGLDPDLITLKKLAEWGKTSLAELLEMMDYQVWDAETEEERALVVSIRGDQELQELIKEFREMAPPIRREVMEYVRFRNRK